MLFNYDPFAEIDRYLEWKEEQYYADEMEAAEEYEVEKQIDEAKFLDD